MVDLTTLGKAVGFTAPFYNLVLVIVTIILFIAVFQIRNRRLYTKPWKIIFIGVLIATLETIMTILRNLGYISFPPAIFPVFEMVILGLFIYALLSQREYVKTGKRT